MLPALNMLNLALYAAITFVIALVDVRRFSIRQRVILVLSGVYAILPFLFVLLVWIPEPVNRPDGTLSRMLGIAAGLVGAYLIAGTQKC